MRSSSGGCGLSTEGAVARGNRTRGAARSPNCGFQKGHPPYYTGGSVPGHAPTNPNGHAETLSNAYRFDQPLGRENMLKGRGRPKDKERECLEALQNGTSPG